MIHPSLHSQLDSGETVHKRCCACNCAHPAISTAHQKLTSLLPLPQTTCGLREAVASWQRTAARGNHRGSHWSTRQTSPVSCTGAWPAASPEHGAARLWTWATRHHWSPPHANSYLKWIVHMHAGFMNYHNSLCNLRFNTTDCCLMGTYMQQSGNINLSYLI